MALVMDQLGCVSVIWGGVGETVDTDVRNAQEILFVVVKDMDFATLCWECASAIELGKMPIAQSPSAVPMVSCFLMVRVAVTAIGTVQ